ncbi:hypothetical protein GGR58DRAFT_503381 [Xylaria digitata]|nr:hypothetical protein GGR58DRAFT_503381 [Xylaria digitata]
MEIMAENLCNIVPGFDKSTYDNSSSRFRWPRLPANCIQWMIDAAIFTYLEDGKKHDEITKRFQFLENSWHELLEIESEENYTHPNCSVHLIYLCQIRRPPPKCSLEKVIFYR